MKKQIEKNTLKLYQICEELRKNWIEYVKQCGEIELENAPEITMWDGCYERIKKLVYKDNDVFLVDWYGHEFSLTADAGSATYQELCDVVFKT